MMPQAMTTPSTPDFGGTINPGPPGLDVPEDLALGPDFTGSPTSDSQQWGFFFNDSGPQSQPGMSFQDHIISTDWTQSSLLDPNTDPSNRLALPCFASPSPHSPLITRLATPFSKASTATTSISEVSEWNSAYHGPRVPKSIQDSPRLFPGLIDTDTLPPVLYALDLTIRRDDHPRLHPGGSSQGRTVSSHPGSSTTQPTSSLDIDLPRSCPNSPQLRPTIAQSSSSSSQLKCPFNHEPSQAAQEWARRKGLDGEKSAVLDELMKFQGLEEVKLQFLDIKSKADVCKKQDPDGALNRLKSERFNIVFQGNPGTGKTTIARLYAKFLSEIKVVGSSHFEETSGIKVATDGPQAINQAIEYMVEGGGGGVLFVDEAYQLTATYISGAGRQALDIILTMMEKHIGKFAVIFVGYKDEMQPFFEHNPGLATRIPYTINFTDFDDAELWRIMVDNITRQYRGRMRVEGGLDGLYMRIAIRRLAQARGSRGFGNARAVENLLARITNRQAQRLTREKRYFTREPDYFLLRKEDIIGPDPSVAAKQCTAWAELQELVGLEHVKQSVGRLVGMIGVNYQRELREESPLRFSLNQLFVGAPGTGKTTVAKLYGRILAQLGYLSRGDVLKNPADFIGECLGKSETKTKHILEATVGKVLVIDEAYMLDAGDSNKDQDKFKKGVIDTIVSMVQGAPGEDRCIVLVGYEDKIRDMFHNVNQGLSRRFPIERPFRFDNFTLDQLEEVLRFKMREQDLAATDAAIRAARDMFERALMRPNFTNAGEVDSVLATAQMNYETRLSRISGRPQTSDFSLDAIDFDLDFDRGERPELDCHGMLDGLVHCNIINRLIGYQQRCLGARRHGLNPREQVPSNFLFKGFPGTGKTTTAQHMGKIFYNMGFLSTSEVIECSATDLLGQYVGQTVPKTLKKLQEGLGHVLFIDDAPQLTDGSYADEAVKKLVDFLSKPANVGRMIVILAGHKDAMNRLTYRHPALSGLFPEEIVFDHIPPDDCITLLVRELAHSGFGSENDFLTDEGSENYPKVRRLFHILGVIPNWSNARDVKNLAKQMVGQILQTLQPERKLSAELIIACMKEMVMQRKSLLATLGLGGKSEDTKFEDPKTVPPVPLPKNAVCPPSARKSGAVDGSVGIDTAREGTGSKNQTHTRRSETHATTVDTRTKDGPNLDGEQQGDSSDSLRLREDGVTDAVWRGLRQAQKEERTRLGQLKAEQQLLRRNLRSAEAAMESCGDQDDDYSDKMAACDAIWTQLTDIQRVLQENATIQQTLQEMNRCVNGYSWTRESGGYRCEGGMHFVTDAEVQTRMT